jgi:hypothetical protein
LTPSLGIALPTSRQGRREALGFSFRNRISNEEHMKQKPDFIAKSDGHEWTFYIRNAVARRRVSRAQRP